MTDPGVQPGTAAVEIREVVRSYDAYRALDGLTLRVPPGAVFGILGPNGSGKSTLLSLLAGGDQPDEGSITVLGRVPGPATRRETGVVFQEGTLDPLATTGENLELSGRMFGLARSECRARGVALLASFGLEGRYDAPVQSLSGGMRRRVELARALLHRPQLLLLDEPTTGIDAEERQVAWQRLREFAGSGGTVVLATNDLQEAEKVCSACAFLSAGRIVAQGSPEELMTGLRREAIVLDWAGDTAEGCSLLLSVEGVAAADADGDTILLAVDDATAVAPRLFAAAGGQIAGLRIRRATLEDAYFQHVARRSPPVPAGALP